MVVHITVEERDISLDQWLSIQFSIREDCQLSGVVLILIMKWLGQLGNQPGGRRTKLCVRILIMQSHKINNEGPCKRVFSDTGDNSPMTVYILLLIWSIKTMVKLAMNSTCCKRKKRERFQS